MHDDRDPVQSALCSLRSQSWDRAHHKEELEEKLMEQIMNDAARGRKGGALKVLLSLVVLFVGGMAGAATFAVVDDWWEDWTIDEKDLGDGKTQVTIKDGGGDVLFDHPMEEGQMLGDFLDEDGNPMFVIVRPVDDSEVPEEEAADPR